MITAAAGPEIMQCGACESPMAGSYCSIQCENLPPGVLGAIHDRNALIHELERRIKLAGELLGGRSLQELAAENRSDWFS